MLNIVGALFYLCTMVLAALAARQSRKAGRPVATFVHWRTLALMFAGLAVWRLSDGEALVQGLARDLAHNAGSYDTRRDWQGPFVGLALFAGAACMVLSLVGRHGNAEVHWSRAAATALLIYAAVRTVSLHYVDSVLYASVGPFHVNHFIDLGLTFTIGYFAIVSIRKDRRRRRR